MREINTRDKKVINLKYRINKLDTRDINIIIFIWSALLITWKIFGIITLEGLKALITNDKKIINNESILLKL